MLEQRYGLQKAISTHILGSIKIIFYEQV